MTGKGGAGRPLTGLVLCGTCGVHEWVTCRSRHADGQPVPDCMRTVANETKGAVIKT